MKKILVVFAMVCFTLNANAQKIFLQSQYGRYLDTLTNTTNKYLTTPSNALNTASQYGGYDIQLNLTNLTGTITTGVTCVLQSSIDGTYYTTHFKCAGTNGVNCDTLMTGTINSLATFTHIWTILSNPVGSTAQINAVAGLTKQTNSGRRLYFRVLMIPSGTHKQKSILS